jgi:CBS domain-containing protein
LTRAVHNIFSAVRGPRTVRLRVGLEVRKEGRGIGLASPESMQVGELCTRRVATVRPDESLIEAARRMRQEHVGDLVVVSAADPRQPVGMLTDRDIVIGVLAKDDVHLSTLDVGDVIVPQQLVTATEDEDLEQALHRMRSFGVRRLPVLDAEGALVGLLSLDDILEALADHVAEIARLISRGRREETLQRPA